MRLTTIQATALKGQTFTHALGAATLFTGRNDAGKTARTDAVRLVLLGYLPEHGKTNAATFALSSASKMSVEADIEAFGAIRREWAAKGKTIKATETSAGALPETPLVLLDGEEYFGKSDAQRVQMLWQTLNVDPEEWTPATVLLKLRDATGTVWDDLPKGAIVEPEKGETLQAWMERLGETLKSEASTARAEVRRWEQTAQGITSAALTETPVDAARVEADLTAATKALEELLAAHARLSEVARQQDSGASRQATVKSRIADLLAKLGDRPLSATQSIEGLEAAATAMEQKRATLLAERRQQEQQATEARKAAERLEAVQKRLEAARKDAEQLDAARATLARLEGELAALGDETPEHVQNALASANRAKADAEARQRANDEARQKLEAEAQAMITKPCCPICGTKGELFHDLVEKRFAASSAELQSEAVAIGTDYQAAVQALEKAQTAQNTAIKVQRHRQALERQIGEARLAEQRALEATHRVADAKEEIAAIGVPPYQVALPSTTQLEELAKEIAHLREEADRLRLNERLAAAQEELRAISIEGDDDAGQRAAETEDRIEAQRARLLELEEQRKAAANQAADKKRLAQAAEEKERAIKQHTAISVTQDALAGERVELIKATFGPLLEVANRFTQGILDTPIEYQNGEIGRYKKGSWVPVRCMGGTHQSVTYAGIQAALGASAPAKLVLVDELGRFDRENKRTFVGNVLAALSEGLVEQFIAIDVDGSAYAGIDGLTLVAVG